MLTPLSRATRGICTLAALIVAARGPAGAQDRGAVALGELAQGLGVSARVLMIGAHPDDENTALITWLARGRQVETAYLSLTRGDGGQNLIGNQLGEALGAIRTEELLAARRLDGGRQYFTRAYDFGFSKSAEETYRHWPHDALLGDVVTVIRAFRPHVIVSVFSGTRRDGHGHHEVAGQLAREGYDAATDTVRFPTRAHGRPWSPAKFYRGSRFAPDSATVSFDVGEFSPLRGRSYAELAGESRSQHKSQAFGSLQRKGAILDYLRVEHTRAGPLPTPKSERTLFDGIDSSWARFAPRVRRAALDSLQRAFAAASEAMNVRTPATVLAPLARVQRLLDLICTTPCADPDLDRSVEIARARSGQLLHAATGIAVEATAEREVHAVGDSIPVRVTVYNRGETPLDISTPAVVAERDGRMVRLGQTEVDRARLEPGKSQQFALKVSADRRSQSWWLAVPRAGDMFAAPVRGIADDTRGTSFAVAIDVSAAGAVATLTTPIEYRFADPVRGEVGKTVVAAPAVSVVLAHQNAYVPANRPVERTIRVSLKSAATDARTITVSLALPDGIRADSSARTVSLPAGGARDVDFVVRGRLTTGTHLLRASATVAGSTARFDSGYVLVEYDHIRPQRLYRAAGMQLRAVDVVIPPRVTVAYIPGAGDNVAEPLRDLGLPVTVIDPRDLSTADLSKYTAVVIGPRAYEASDPLVEQNARVLNFARNGGTVVVQYGQYEMTQPGMLPYAITLSRPADRVTVEEAPVRVLAPSSPLLNYPNRLSERDFEGWVQERGLYMPRQFDQAWTPLFSTNDPGEPENRGAVLVAPVGRGMYVYTSFSLFRQLPAGVPGAARLIINLIVATQAGSATQ